MGLKTVIEVILQRDDYHLLSPATRCMEHERQTGGAATHIRHTRPEREVMGCPDWRTLWECLL